MLCAPSSEVSEVTPRLCYHMLNAHLSAQSFETNAFGKQAFVSFSNPKHMYVALVCSLLGPAMGLEQARVVEVGYASTSVRKGSRKGFELETCGARERMPRNLPIFTCKERTKFERGRNDTRNFLCSAVLELVI